MCVLGGKQSIASLRVAEDSQEARQAGSGQDDRQELPQHPGAGEVLGDAAALQQLWGHGAGREPSQVRYCFLLKMMLLLVVFLPYNKYFYVFVDIFVLFFVLCRKGTNGVQIFFVFTSQSFFRQIFFGRSKLEARN